MKLNIGRKIIFERTFNMRYNIEEENINNINYFRRKRIYIYELINDHLLSFLSFRSLFIILSYSILYSLYYFYESIKIQSNFYSHINIQDLEYSIRYPLQRDISEIYRAERARPSFKFLVLITSQIS